MSGCYDTAFLHCTVITAHDKSQGPKFLTIVDWFVFVEAIFPDLNCINSLVST